MSLKSNIFNYIVILASILFADSTSAAYIESDSYTDVADSLYNTLEEVDVVAIKQGSSYRQDAVSGNLLGREAVERLGISDVKSFSEAVPNFHIPNYGSRITSSIYVRGIGARMDQPAVGLTVDNIGVLNKNAYDFDLSDIASMEMLRGPQSTLFGRNTMSGLINIRTLSPLEFSGWRGSVRIGLNSLFKMNLGWYHTFNEETGLAIVGSFNRYGGHFVNQFNENPVDREVGGSLRVKFYYSPSSKVVIDNTLNTSILRQGGYAYASVETGLIDYNDTCYYHRYLLNDGLSIKADLGPVQLVSVTSLQHMDDNMTLDQDFTRYPYFTLTQKQHETALTEDLMMKGDAAGGKYKWLAGVYGFYRHLNMTAPVTFKDYGIETLIEEHRNEANPKYPIKWNEPSFPLNSRFKMPSGGFAIYHESRFDLGSWTLTAGIRMDYEYISMSYNSYCNTSYTIYKNPTGTLPADYATLEPFSFVKVDLEEKGHLTNHFLEFLPKITVMKNFPEGHNIYVSAGKGYKAGGFNTQMFSDVLQQKLMAFMGIGGNYKVEDIVSYRPEKAWNFELGTHLSFFSSKLLVDASLFYIDCYDQQLTKFPEGQVTGRMMTNAGKTRSWGGELSVNSNPMDRLSIIASYGYTNARFTKYDDGKMNYAGKRLPYSPANTLFGEVAYRLPISTNGDNYFDIAVNFNGVGNIYWNEANTLKQDLYGLLGASVKYESPYWSVELWGKNLTGTSYNTFYFMSMSREFLQKGDPRMLGITLRARF